MPEETAEQKAARESAEARDRELNERIVAGVTAGLKPVIEKLSEREKEAPVVTRSAEPAVITRPSDEQRAKNLESTKQALNMTVQKRIEPAYVTNYIIANINL